MNRNPILPLVLPNYGACRRPLYRIDEEVESNFTNESRSPTQPIFRVDRSDRSNEFEFRSTTQSILTIDDSDGSSGFSVGNDSVNEFDLPISALKKVMLLAIPSVLLLILGVYTHATKVETNESLSIDVAEVFGTSGSKHVAAHILDLWLSNLLD